MMKYHIEFCDSENTNRKFLDKKYDSDQYLVFTMAAVDVKVIKIISEVKLDKTSLIISYKIGYLTYYEI